MPLFDVDKRTKGLRLPSMKPNGLPSRPNHLIKLKKASDNDESTEAANPATFSIRVSSKPVAQGTPEKQLPPAPSAQAASISPAPLPSPPTVPTDKMSPVQNGVPLSRSPPHREVNGLPPRPNNHNHNHGVPNGTSSAGNLAPGPPPLQNHRPAAVTPPPDEDIPLEDFIPDPLDDDLSPATTNGVLTPSSGQANGDSGSDSWLPPAPEPIAAPLTRVHFNCYQDHRNMMPSGNYWYPVPCMTCLKQDRETRHRCVFCCLRICTACYGNLRKCNNRSLAELMDLLR